MASLLLKKEEGAEAKARLPSLEHLLMEDYENVYEPAEDTYLLCDALEMNRDQITLMKPKRALEIGSGSGCVITFFGQVCKQLGVQCSLYATDINKKAVDATKRTAAANEVEVAVSNVDLLGNNSPADNSVDVLLFNPPYVPTPSSEVGSSGIEAAWAGGIRGREVIDRFLPSLPSMLSRPHGRCYLILVKDNRPEEISDILTEMGLQSSIVLTKRARNESLLVMLITFSEELQEEVTDKEDSAVDKAEYSSLP